MPVSEKIQRLADQWLEYDFNEPTRKEIQELLAKEDEATLSKRLETRIAFGTAGLRGRMAAGNACMNHLVVCQASQGLATHVAEAVPDSKTRGVVVGYDGRYNSKDYAIITAAVFLSLGFKVHLFSRIVPTPFVPYYITLRNCAAGVMVTASHNPKDDNGYKVYWDNGAQIISPTDEHIAKAIDANLKPWDGLVFDEQAVRSHPQVADPLEETIDNYYSQIREKYCFTPESNPSAPLKVTYTAMHGVGCEWTRRAFESFDLPPFIPVKEQVEIDPEFPTVPFPNPEEGRGALALSIATADANDSPLILANDPDADRLAVAEKQPSGEWRILNGNEIALLLAHWAWKNFAARHPEMDKSKAFMVSSTVSSKILQGMARKEGFYFEDTLTGFKWMGNKAYELERQGMTFIFAFEVEIGFLVGNISLDKDGVRTAAIFAEMANAVYRSGKNLVAHMQDLYAEYGYYMMNTRYFFCYSPETMALVFDRLRIGFDGGYVKQVGSHKIKYIRDLTTGYDSSQPDNKAVLPVSRSSQMITFTFEDGSVCTLRNSGTEPKVKYYVEVFDESSPEAAKEKLADLTQAVIRELLMPEHFGLIAPSD